MDDLVAWCIVPFDSRKRTPEERIAMLERLGFKRYAYDWRAEHLPDTARELRLARDHGIRIEAVWSGSTRDRTGPASSARTTSGCSRPSRRRGSRPRSGSDSPPTTSKAGARRRRSLAPSRWSVT